MQDYYMMSKDRCIAKYLNGTLQLHQPSLVPIHLQRTGYFEGWLETRAVDGHRANSRLLKKALRLESKDDVSTVLHFNAATITDTYWVKPSDSALTYEDVRFTENLFDTLALRGDPDSFNRKPSRTPELTNTGSFEKCWRLIDGQWWIYKAETTAEQFTELFACYLGEAPNIPVAVYEIDAGYIRSLDLTNGASVNFETAYGIIGDESDYREIYRMLLTLDTGVAAAYVQMTFFDALIFNMDRHEHNFGVLREVDNGNVLGMAPLFDHNIALITRGFPTDITRTNDRLIADFIELIHQEQPVFSLPTLTSEMVTVAAQKAMDAFPDSQELPMGTVQFVRDFVLNGYRQIEERAQMPVKKKQMPEPER